MEECANHWKDATFDEFPINVSVIQCSNNNLLSDDYVRVKEFLKSPLRQAHEFSDLQKEFQAMFKHVDRYSNEAVFTKCSNVDCCDSWKALDVQSFLNRHNMKQFAPVNSASLSGHYETFLNLSLMESGFKYRDEGQPSRDKKTLSTCEFCPSLTIFSKTEKDRHKSLFHRRRKPQQGKPKEFICEVCSDDFDSSSSLTQHKTAKGHTQKAMKRKALNDPLINVPPSKCKSRKQKSAAESSTKVTEKGRKQTIKDFL